MSSQRKTKQLNSTNIKVLIRCRPLLEFQNQPAWQVSNSNKIQCMRTKSVKLKIDKENRKSEAQISAKFKQLSYQFEKVYYDKLTSEQIYKQETRDLVQQCLVSNKNLTLMSYGQTCSGKTFTILGQQKFPGLMPCLLRDLMIFKRESSTLCNINISYFEIYNQSIYDLLVERRKSINTQKLKLYEDKKYGWEVAGVKIEKVESFDQCVKLIEKGEQNRSYASKQNHDRSSRSHTMIRIYIEKQDHKYNKTQQIFNILDLAGSQRLNQNSKNIQETASINKSLFQLSNVISKLSVNESGGHIPYRDSKLTRLLESSLKGNGKCVIIFCISPAVESFNESLSTLRLAKKAKIIEFCPSQQDLTQNWSLLERELFQTRQKLARKQALCQQLESRLDYLTQQLTRLQSYVDEIESKCQVKIDLTALVDHENFLIKDLGNGNILDSFLISEQNQKNESELQACQIQMKRALHQLYQNYIEDIVTISLNQLVQKHKNSSISQNKFIINVHSFALKNILFDENIQLQSKLKGVQKFITDLQKPQNHLKNTNHIQLLQLAKQYHHHLYQKIQKQSHKQQSSLTNMLSFQTNQNNIQKSQRKTKEINRKIEVTECKNIYTWGCSKDGRIFKGNQVLPGIFCLPNESYGVIKKVITSFNHNLFLNDDGEVFGWGKNNFNQVSSKDTPSHSLPREIRLKEKVTSIATGWGHSLALTEDKKVFSWGYGQNGQLGHGDLTNVPKPKLIEFQHLIEEIYAGHSHSALLDSQCQLHTFGFNKDYRCLIRSEDQFITLPKRIPLKNIKCASLGVSHTAIITKQLSVFCGGIGTNGEFGKQLSQQIDGCELIEVENRKFQNKSDRFEKICALIELQFQSSFDETIMEVKCAQNSTYFLTDLGNLYICGKNINKRNSHNIYQPKLMLSNVSSFNVGSSHGFAFSNNNQIYGWGFNMYNQLGNYKEKDLNSPEIITGISSFDLSSIHCGFIHTIALGK